MKSIHIKLLYVVLFVMVFTAIMSGCKKEENQINPLPNITIAASTVTQKYIGDVINLDPAVSYGGQEANFSYKWYKVVPINGSTSVYRQIADKKALSYTLDSLGTLSLKLDATNTATGITASSFVSFSVISRAEQGWYLLKSNESGNTDMDGYFTTTAGSQKSANIISTKTGAPLSGSPVSLGFSAFYTWYNPATKAFVSGNLCLFPVSSKEVIAYRIRDERLLANTDQLFFQSIPLASRNFQALVCDPNLMVIVNNGKVLGMNPGSNAFLPERSGDYTVSSNLTIAPYKFNNVNLGYVMGFDEKSGSLVNIRYKQTDISYFPDNYLSGPKFNYPYNISSNKIGGKMVMMENTDGTLDSLLSSNGRAYALVKKTGSADMFILGLNTELLIPARYSNSGFSPVAFRQDLTSASYPELTSASLYTLNKNNPVLYFAKNNTIGFYNIETRTYNANMFSFPAGEEITYIKFLDVQYDTQSANNFRNLVVATYSNGNYKFYRFSVLSNTLTQIGTPFEGIGRVKSALYTVPNSSSTATYTSLFHSMYRYY